jgi:hypothetical protein
MLTAPTLIILTIFMGLVVVMLITGFILSARKKDDDLLKRIERPATLVEGARLMIDPTGNLYAEIDDKVYRSAAELAPETRARLMQLAKSLQDWLGIKSETPTSLPPTEVVEQAAPPEPNNVGLGVPGILNAASKVDLNPVNLFAKALQSQATKAPPLPQSMSAQIDAILQGQLEGTDLEQRGVRLMELPGKGMVVLVGLDQYSGVDEVPDEAIKAAIRNAVKAWEDKAVGG